MYRGVRLHRQKWFGKRQTSGLTIRMTNDLDHECNVQCSAGIDAIRRPKGTPRGDRPAFFMAQDGIISLLP